jgi:hypothetical protein
MMAGFNGTGREVNVVDVMIGCGVTQKNACEQIVIEFSGAVTGPFNTNARAEYFKL